MSSKHQKTDTAVTFEKVTVSIGSNLILDKVTARVPQGSNTAIIGPNGAGKTTMLLALLNQISFQGKITTTHDGSRLSPRIGYVPQQLQFDRGMPLTVLEFMVIGQQRLPLWFGVRKKHRQKAHKLLKAVNASNLENRKLGAISGGEMQRVLLALAIGQDPDLLLLDEPTAGIDLQGEYIFCDLLEELRQKHGFTQLMISHDLPTVTHHATHVICLNRKIITEGPPREVLTTETLTAVFGKHMGLVNSQALPTGKGSCTASCCIKEDEDD